jgi:hypothetical protein
MKTTVKQLAAGTFVAFLLLVGNVNAEGTEVKASSHENMETTLQLEEWMTNESFWNSNSVNISNFGVETEAKLELEDWMTSEENWNSSNNMVEETEAGMEIESWMTSEEAWNPNFSVNETELKVENWMIESKIWK